MNIALAVVFISILFLDAFVERALPWFGEYPDATARRTGPGRLNTVFQTWRYHADQLPWLAR